MIFDKIACRGTYAADYSLNKALDFMASITTENFPDIPVPLDGDRLFINVSDTVTRPENACLFEAHRRYIDVHVVVEGCETIIVQNIDALQIRTPYSEENDCALLTGEGGVAVTLRPGDFLVCYPQDAHKVGIAPHQPAPLKKMIAKILL